MSEPESPAPAAPEAPSSRRWLYPGVFGLALASTFVLFDAKPGAVLGRYSFLQFLLALILLVLFALSLRTALLPPEKRRDFRINATVSLVTTVIAFGALELSLFFLPVKHQMDNPWYVFAGGVNSTDDDLPYGRPAHVSWRGLSRGDLAIVNDEPDPYAGTVEFKTDMAGFRNHTDMTTAEMIAIGDSFTEAGNMPEEETYPVLAGRRLGVTVRNLARAGYTTPNELVVLERYGLQCSPRTVVWQIAESNDLIEARAHDAWVRSGRPQIFGKVVSGYLGWKRRSPMFKLFALLRTRPEALGGRFRDAQGAWHPVRFLNVTGPDQSPAGHSGWPTFSSALERGLALCREHDARPVVLLVPNKFRVMGAFTELNETTRRAVQNTPQASEQDSLAPWLRRLCEQRGVTFVDTTEALTARARAGELVYLPFDTHLSAAGHRVVAEVLSAALATQAAR
ncbi:GDSL-type esterase/lipase family protein [Sorangium sp. So ce260]|uniref:SGNH/GDSL hydrolase family protein n=1 Tax=Sorangium sp. So ce260 TaxID=3133291 RepID=UPI003F60104B